MDKTEKLIDWRENERRDRNRDGIDDRIEPPVPDVSAGSQKLAQRLRENPNADPSLAGGDIDAQWARPRRSRTTCKSSPARSESVTPTAKS